MFGNAGAKIFLQYKTKISLSLRGNLHFDTLRSIVNTFGYRASKKPSVGSLISGSIAGEAQENELCVTG